MRVFYHLDYAPQEFDGIFKSVGVNKERGEWRKNQREGVSRCRNTHKAICTHPLPNNLLGSACACNRVSKAKVKATQHTPAYLPQHSPSSHQTRQKLPRARSLTVKHPHPASHTVTPAVRRIAVTLRVRLSILRSLQD